MRMEDTICHKITDCISEVENAIKTKSLDVGLLSKNLHEIRSSAQKMENGLKDRKAMMEKAGLELGYQKVKGKRYTPPGVNKVAGVADHQVHGKDADEFEYEFIVKQKGEVVYQNKVKAGVISAVEEIEDITPDGAVEGRVQNFIFGHDIAIWYGFDQLRMTIEAHKVRIMDAFRHAVETKAFVDPHVKKQILMATRLMKGQNGGV